MTTLHEAQPRTAVERFCAANGLEVPPPLTPEEAADLEARQRRADEELERLYGTMGRDAA
ncbi:hypothetical protein WEI85_14670 [Actinomycetes bacterium KLBMP 9797]